MHSTEQESAEPGSDPAAGAARFDAHYYARFYGDKPVHDAAGIADLAAGVFGMAGWWQMSIRSVLDVGAGTGLWRDWIAVNRPGVRYHGIDASEHACAHYGHEHADLATWTPPRTYDLVVCQSVLQYLPDREASRAIQTLAGAAGGVLLLEVPTVGDLVEVVDPDGTDLDVHWRTGSWYRRRLDAHFVAIGAGLWVSRSAGVAFFELERSR